jgi:hypothetical protein
LNHPIALADLWLGNFAEALRCGQEFQKLEPRWLTGGLALALQARASQQLGQVSEARRRLAEAEHWHRGRMQERQNPDAVPPGFSAHTWHQFLLLLRNARQAQEALEKTKP